MIEASCHCGSVRFTVETAPNEVTDCNCSVCRRYGALWAYYQQPQVRFEVSNGPTDVYLWGRRQLGFYRCHACGCLTHWMAVDRGYLRMGVNARLIPTEVLAAALVTPFDGASG